MRLFVFACSIAFAFHAAAVADERLPRDLGTPSPLVRAFIEDVHATYLTPRHASFGAMSIFDIAKLMGYAIGEAATRPGAVDVYDPRFRRELEAWFAGLGAEGGNPAAASRAWALVDEGAHGFYDSEMEAKFGHRAAIIAAGAPANGPTSALAWFSGLTPAAREEALHRAALHGLKNSDGTLFTDKQFAAIARMVDAQMDAQRLAPDERRKVVEALATGQEPH